MESINPSIFFTKSKDLILVFLLVTHCLSIILNSVSDKAKMAVFW